MSGKILHYNPETGKIDACRAKKGRCPFIDPSDPNGGHYETQEELSRYIERRAEREVSKDSEKRTLGRPEQRAQELGVSLELYNSFDEEELSTIERMQKELEEPKESLLPIVGGESSFARLRRSRRRSSSSWAQRAALRSFRNLEEAVKTSTPEDLAISSLYLKEHPDLVLGPSKYLVPGALKDKLSPVSNKLYRLALEGIEEARGKGRPAPKDFLELKEDIARARKVSSSSLREMSDLIELSDKRGEPGTFYVNREKAYLQPDPTGVMAPGEVEPDDFTYCDSSGREVFFKITSTGMTRPDAMSLYLSSGADQSSISAFFDNHWSEKLDTPISYKKFKEKFGEIPSDKQLEFLSPYLLKGAYRAEQISLVDGRKELDKAIREEKAGYLKAFREELTRDKVREIKTQEEEALKESLVTDSDREFLQDLKDYYDSSNAPRGLDRAEQAERELIPYIVVEQLSMKRDEDQARDLENFYAENNVIEEFFKDKPKKRPLTAYRQELEGLEEEYLLLTAHKKLAKESDFREKMNRAGENLKDKDFVEKEILANRPDLIKKRNDLKKTELAIGKLKELFKEPDTEGI